MAFGCFILEQLLQQTRGQVVCLVRGADDAQAHARLNSALISFGLLALIDHPRILVAGWRYRHAKPGRA